MLECEGAEAAHSAEVRVVSARSPLLVFQGGAAHSAAGFRTFFQRDTKVSISLLASAWPAKVIFTRLMLRHLDIEEQVGLFAGAALRASRNKRTFSILARLTQNIFAGETIRLRSQDNPQSLPKDVDCLCDSQGDASKLTTSTKRVENGADFSVELRPNQQLHPHAADLVSATFARNPALKAIYADVCENGGIVPAPAWDPELARCYDYSATPIFVRRDALLPGMQWLLPHIVAAYGEGAVRRLSLPLVFGSSDSGPEFAQVPVPELPRPPKVSAIIPTIYHLDLLERCLDSLVSRTDYPDLEVVIVDNGASPAKMALLLERVGKSLPIICIKDNGDFNFSRLVNAGVAASTGEIALLLNDDVEAIDSSWLKRMVDSCLQESVGAVGARLNYADGSLQHAGVILGIGGLCGHLWRGLQEERASRLPQVVFPGSRMAVTGACLAVRREAFDRIGGLDEVFAVAFNDIDFCLRLHELGLRCIYRGDAVLVHRESQSRGEDLAYRDRRRLQGERELFLSRWSRLVERDPYGAPSLDVAVEAGVPHPLAFAPASGN